MKIRKSKTARGFALAKFEDEYGAKCSIQKSSLAPTEAIWFGVDKVEPQILAIAARKLGIPTDKTSGWIPYSIPKEVLISSRMHLTRAQVRKLLPILQRFVDTGDLT